MNKQQIICFQTPIKLPKQIAQFRRRQENHIAGTPKIVLGKLVNDTQQIWTEEYKFHKVSFLRDLHSNGAAFDIALLIVNATKKLSKIYGNFIINENMVFMTKSKKTIVWINPDIFTNSPKIYLPQNKDGQVSMIKGLINYLKLWLQTHYSTLYQIKTLEELSFKLQELKKQKPPSLSKDMSLAAFSIQSSKDSNQKLRLYESSKGITLKKLCKDQQFSKQNSKNSDSSSNQQKCSANRCFTSQPIGQKYLKKRWNNQKGQTSQNSNVQSGSQGDRGSFSNSFSKQVSKSFRNLKSLSKEDEPKFPNKTTSSTLHILQKIKQQDDSPDVYTSNKILMDESDKSNLEQQQKNKLKTELGGINEELDNLFMSNVQSEENQVKMIQREREFQEILDI